VPDEVQPPNHREQVQLGNRIVELEPEQAAAVRQSFQDLAGAYGAAVDQQRRQILESLGRPGWQAPMPMAPATPELPASIDIPDTDLLFSNKDIWTQGLGNALEMRLAQQNAQQTAIVQGALQAVQSELNQRDRRQQAQTVHDAVMEEMLERRGLDENRRLVQTIYNEQYQTLGNLPLNVAIDQIGQLAQEEIARIRGEEPPTPAEPVGQQPAPPRFLSSARRAGTTSAPPAAPAKTLSDLIRRHHAIALTGKAA